MGTSYTRDAAVEEMVRDRIKEAHEDMHRHGVRVCVLMASSDKGHAVKHAGYNANATVSVVPLKDRVTKGYDAEIIIDQVAWQDFRPRQRLALIAHELNHLRLVRKKDKFSGMLIVQTDDIGRPKLKTVPGDWNAGDGFRSIVREFGKDAVEFANIRAAWAFAEAAAEAGPPEPEPTLFAEVELVEGEVPEEEPRPADPACPPSDIWKKFPIERWTRFGLTKADVAKLAEGRTKTGDVHPIHTVGDLSAFTSNPTRPGRSLSDLAGFGVAAVDRLAEAESKFWAWWTASGELAFAEEVAEGSKNGDSSLAGTGSPNPRNGGGFDLIDEIERGGGYSTAREILDSQTKGW